MKCETVASFGEGIRLVGCCKRVNAGRGGQFYSCLRPPRQQHLMELLKNPPPSGEILVKRAYP